MVPGFDYDNARVKRTLTRLMIEDTVAGLKYVVVPLPHGSGVVFYLEGETYSAVAFHLARTPKDTLFLNAKKVDGVEQYLLEDSSYLAIAPASGFADEFETSGIGSFLQRELKNGKRHVVLAFDRDARRARQVAETYVKMKREQLENAVLDSLASILAFSLMTEDDETNRAFAVLSASLANAQPQLGLNSPAEIEQAAACATGMFLASRARTNVAFGSNRAKNLSPRVRWGPGAYRAALFYGMAAEDSLKRVSLDVLANAAKLHGEQAENLFVLGDDAVSDTLMKLAIAHIRYAEILNLCADIAAARGDRGAETSYRRDSGTAYKSARRYFAGSKSYYRSLPPEQELTLTEKMSALEAELDDVELMLSDERLVPPPDTALYVSAGAHYGFSWLAEKPSAILPESLDGYTWQKWTAYRFGNDYKVTQTPDLDSTIAVLLHGPLPGALTENPGVGGEPSLPVMAAAYENLAELYLGFRPNWLIRRVDLEPRPPQSWGHTKARIPFGSGFILLDYDFENSKAIIAMQGIDGKLDVFFGCPLPTGGFARTQFALSEDAPKVRIRAERDIENRVKLSVKIEN